MILSLFFLFDYFCLIFGGSHFYLKFSKTVFFSSLMGFHDFSDERAPINHNHPMLLMDKILHQLMLGTSQIKTTMI